MIEEFRLESLATIDGGLIREAFEQAMRRCRADCEDRPGVDKPRKVTVVATFTPTQASDGTFDSCDVQFDVDDTLPKRQSPRYNMKVERGRLFYNEMSPDAIRQRTLDDAPRPQATEGA